jgi:hypothetical protein
MAVKAKRGGKAAVEAKPARKQQRWYALDKVFQLAQETSSEPALLVVIEANEKRRDANRKRQQRVKARRDRDREEDGSDSSTSEDDDDADTMSTDES